MTHCGLDVLQLRDFRELKGRAVGAITNHTGLNRDLKPTIDLIHESANVDLKALFGPEHGIRGEVDEAVSDSVDTLTGLPVYSLYGRRTKPSMEQLSGLDTLVYDIQDVGCRFYTYISTLGNCLEAAAEAGLRFIVLDRPNPIGGVEIEGPIADSASLDFIAYHSIPIRHGLTVGEMAKLLVLEKGLSVDLEVIPCEGWKRDRLWDATGLTWTNPSPNMRSLAQALLYPGIGLLEFTNLSVGRGTDTPFEIFGAPWIRGRELALELNRAGLPGVRFVPIRFNPSASKHANALCEGINLIVTDRTDFIPVLTGLKIAELLLKLFPTEWESEKYSRLLVHRESFHKLLNGESAETIAASWEPELHEFRKRIATIQLYE